MNSARGSHLEPRTTIELSEAQQTVVPSFSRIIIASHYWAAGVIWALKKYVQPRAKEMLVIAHPLFPGTTPSYAEVYSGGVLIDRREWRTGIGMARYPTELWTTARWTNQVGRNADVFIAADGLLGLVGLWLRRRKLVSSVLLYSVDFVPNRFGNPVMNSLYHQIDRYNVRNVDIVWNVTKEIELARKKRDGSSATAPQLVVPVGADFSQIKRGQQQSSASHEIVFVGHLLEKQGVQLAIQAMPKVLTAVPDAKLVIIGDGPYAPKLRELASRCGMNSAVSFVGPFFDDLDIANRLTGAAVGIAPYVPSPASFTNFADPGKIKIYLACGLPVITTRVPPIAETIEREGAGTVIDYSVDDFASTALKYLQNGVLAQQAKRSALAMGARFDWNLIFDSAWQATLPLLGHDRQALAGSAAAESSAGG